MFLRKFADRFFANWKGIILTEIILCEICRNKGVFLVYTDKVEFGRYLQFDGHDFILINPNLPHIWRRWVLMHEIAHFALGVPCDFSKNSIRKADYEANYISAVMLISLRDLKHRPIPELLEEFPMELIVIRNDICKQQRNKF